MIQVYNKHPRDYNMKITAADVGRQVRDARGKIETITGFHPPDQYPVKTDLDEYLPSGIWMTGDDENENNLVEFVDDPWDGMTPVSDSDSQPIPPSPMALILIGRLAECDDRDTRTALVSSLLTELGVQL